MTVASDNVIVIGSSVMWTLPLNGADLKTRMPVAPVLARAWMASLHSSYSIAGRAKGMIGGTLDGVHNGPAAGSNPRRDRAHSKQFALRTRIVRVRGSEQGSVSIIPICDKLRQVAAQL